MYPLGPPASRWARARRLTHAGGGTFWRALLGWIDHRCSALSAALAFYAMFSLAPMLLVIIALAGYFFGADATSGQLYSQLRQVVGPEAAAFVQVAVQSAWNSRASTGATWISVIVIVIGASVTFAELKSALNTIFVVTPSTDVPLLRSTLALVRARVLSFALVSGLAFLLIVLLAVDTAVVAFQHALFADAADARGTKVFLAMEKGFSLVLLTVSFTVLLRVLPDTTVSFRAALIGAACGSALFVLGKSLFSMYLTNMGTTDVFGAAGSLAVILMWLYYSSAVFLFGAEIARELAEAKLDPATITANTLTGDTASRTRTS
jgi:membrane protein